MNSLFAILVGLAIANQFVLVRIPALSALAVDSGRLRLPVVAWPVTALVLTAGSAGAYLADAWLLRAIKLRELRLPALVVAVLASAPLAVFLVGLGFPKRREILGRCRSMVTANSAMLGAALVATSDPQSLAAAIAWGVGTAVGFCTVLGLFGDLGERLADADVPVPLKGVAIALVTGGIVSIAFSGLADIVRG